MTDGGLAFVGDYSGTVHLLNTGDGTEMPTYRASTAQIWSAVVVDDPYRAYFGTQTGHAIGLDAHGATMFDVDLGAPVDSYPALTADATLIIGDRNGTLSAITSQPPAPQSHSPWTSVQPDRLSGAVGASVASDEPKGSVDAPS